MPMEEITSPPSSFSPVRRVEPTSPIARMLTRFFPEWVDHFRISSQPGRAVLMAVSRPSAMACRTFSSTSSGTTVPLLSMALVGPPSKSGSREASSASSPWPASSWPG